MNGYTYFKDTNNQLKFSDLLKNKNLKKLSIASKAAYCILYDAMISSGRPDRNGHIYITYTIKQLMSDLSVSKQTAINYIAELTKAGMIKKYKRGLGQPSLIYVMDTNPPKQEKNAGQESIHSEVKNIDPIYNNYNIHTNYSIKDKLNNINNISNPIQSSDEKKDYDYYLQQFEENLDVQSLKEKHPDDSEMIDGMVEIIADTMLINTAKITVASRSVSAETVKSRLNRLKAEHVEYVLECFNNTATTVRNISKYILASLYNAPATYAWYLKNIKSRNEKQEEKSENKSNEKRENKSRLGNFGNFNERDYDMQAIEKMLLTGHR